MKKTILVWATALALLLGTLIWWQERAREPQSQPTPGRLDAVLPPPAAAAVGAELPEQVPLHLRTSVEASGGRMRTRVTGSLASSQSSVPLLDATVVAWPSTDVEPDDGRTRRTGRTDATGTVVFADLAAGTWSVRARLGELAASDKQSVVVAPGTTIDCALHIALSRAVQGRVVDEDGRGIADAEIWAGSSTMTQPASPDELLRLAARSGSDGKFALAHAAGEESIAARKAGYAASWAHGTTQSGDGDVTLVLARGAASLAGVVVDSEDHPVVGASLGLQLQDENFHRHVDGTLRSPHMPVSLRSDALGRFAAADLAPGVYSTRVCAPLHKTTTLSFTVDADGQATVRVQLEHAVTLRGCVRNPRGEPLGGVYVWIEGASGSATTTVTTSSGRFTFVSLPARPFVVQAARTAFPIARHAFTTDVRGHLTCELTLDALPDVPPPGATVVAQPLARLAGRVVDVDGHPLIQAAVELIDPSGTDSKPHQVDAAAAFCLEELAAGNYTLVVTAPGRQRSLHQIALAPAQEVQLGALVLAVGSCLRVRLLRPDGTPWRDYPPLPWLMDAHGKVLMTDRTGRVDYAVEGAEVVMTGLAPGRYRLHAPQADELVIEPRDVVLGAGATLRIDVPVAIGRRRTLMFVPPPEEARSVLHVEVHRSTGQLVLQTDCARGGFSSQIALTHTFLPGDYQVTATTDSGARYQTAFTVSSEPGTLTLEVPLVR